MKSSIKDEKQGKGFSSLLFVKTLCYRKVSITMNKIYNFETKKGNSTIKTKIDLRLKTLCKTILVTAMVIVLILGVIKWLN